MEEKSLDQELETTGEDKTSEEKETQTNEKSVEAQTNEQSVEAQKAHDTLDSVLSAEEKENYLNKYVGEGKKYRNIEDLAKSYAHAEAFINTLKKEKEEMEEEMERLREASKIVKELEEENKNESEKEIENRISEAIRKEREREREIENKKLLKQILLDSFKDEQKAVKAVSDFIGSDPIKKEVFNKLAASDPKAASKLLGIDNPQQTKINTNTTIKEGSAVGNSVVDAVIPITWSEAKRVRREDPTTYKSHSFQQKLHRAALEAEKQGINFFNT